MKLFLKLKNGAGRSFLAVLFLLFGWNHWASANQIDIGIFESSTPGKIEVRIRPDFTIYGAQTITAILYTLRWTDETIVITTLDNIAPFGVAFDGPPVLDEGYYYQKFWAVPMSPVGSTIPAGSERLISSFAYTGSDDACFELIENAWTEEHNGGPSIELTGIDYYGIIYAPFAPIPCTISLTCPGDISVAPASGECGATVTYTTPVAGGDCSDVTIVQTAGLPSGSYFPSGTTTNSFQAISSEGPTASCSFTVTVNALPGAAGSITGTSQVCRNQTGVVYSVEPVTGATSYAWTYTGAGATINGNGNTVTIDFGNLATSGNLKVRGVNLCGMGPASPNFLITVNPVPGAAGPITGTSTVCQGQGTVSYSVAPIAFATGYVWDYSGTGATINGSSTSVTVSFSPEATSGSLTVYGTNLCGSGAVSPAFSVTVNPLPGAAGAIAGPSAVCQGQDDVTYSITAIPDATSYVWNYSGTGATIVNNGTTALVSFSLTATAGSLTVQGVNSCGNGTASPAFPVTVDPLPGPAGPITGTTQVCQGQANVAFSVEPIPDATTYGWYYSGTGATISGSGPSVTVDFSAAATSGDLTVQGLNSCGNGATSPAYPVTVNGVPEPAGTISGAPAVCQDQEDVSFSVTLITGATGYVWAYSGTGATINGTGNSVTVSFSQEATSGNLSVYGTNFCGDGTASPDFPVTVNPLPGPAGIITGPASLCQGQDDVAYTIAAIPFATSYVWQYSGTGATISGTGASVTVAFSTSATSGDLTVYGVNDCGDGADSPGYAITVNTLPLSPVSGGNEAICADQPIPPLTVIVGAGETADWYADADGGEALASGTISYTPITAGTFYAQARNLTTGCQSLSRTAVTLIIHPLPDVFAGADQNIPNGTSTTISDATASGAAPLSFIWDPASAFVDPSELNPTTVNLLFTYEYDLAVTDGHGCVAHDQMTITITGGPLGANPAADPGSFCTGEETQLHANASGGSGEYTYTWTSVPEGFTSSLSNPMASPAVTTLYTVEVFDGFNTVMGSVTVTVHPLPEVYAGADQYIPFGASTLIADATASGEPELSYFWTPSDAFMDATVLNPITNNLTSSGDYTLTVTDGHGCQAGDGMTITISGNELIVDPDSDPGELCEGGTTQLTSGATGGSGTYSYSWVSEPPGFSSTQADPQASPAVTTTYTVVVDDGYSTVSGTVTVTVLPLPVVTCPGDLEALPDDPPFELTGGLPAGGTYSGDGVAGGLFDPAAAGNGEHTITYAYEDENGCTNLCTFVITVSGDVISGDANCDGVVNVLDIITIVNYIFELNPVPFCFDEADVNDDLIINVMDVIGTVNIIMAP